MKDLNYRVGALKRKFKIEGDFAPGTLIDKANAQKVAQNKGKMDMPSKPSERAAIMGAV